MGISRKELQLSNQHLVIEQIPTAFQAAESVPHSFELYSWSYIIVLHFFRCAR